MVDIMDMEDIFHGIIMSTFTLEMKVGDFASSLAHKLILEVADYLEAQQTIACNNCKGKKFKAMKEAWQVF